MPSFVKAIYKQHMKMTSQAAVAHSSAKKGKKRGRAKITKKESTPYSLPPKAS